MHNIALIISREYLSRVKKKAFIFTTLAMPVVLLALMFTPVLLQNMGSDIPKTITVVDQSGQMAAPLTQHASLNYTFSDEPLEDVIQNDGNQYILVYGPDIVDNPSDVTFYARETSSLELEMALSADTKEAIETLRLIPYNLSNLNQILDEINADVNIKTLSINDKGETEASDTLTGFLVGMVAAVILYFFIMIYGQLVMQSVIEEKSSRVLELIVTSVKPTHLMLGKIIGVGAVAVTQVLIWCALIALFIQFGLPAILGDAVYADMAAFANGTYDPNTASTSIGMLQMLMVVGSLSYIMSVFGYILIFLIGGFLLYASIYAAIGAAVSTPQDGAQLQVFAMVPIIIGFIYAMSVGQNPNTDTAVILSIIPFTSPMVMLARIPLGVPAGQLILSIAVLYATFAVTVWFTAKIYRTGIFMYGKKPSIKELIRWSRYK